MGVPQQVALPGGDSGTQAPSLLCLCHTHGGGLKLPCRLSPFQCVCEKVCDRESVSLGRCLGVRGQACITSVHALLVKARSDGHILTAREAGNTGWGRSRFTVVSTQNTEFILVLLINYCTILYTNNCKPSFVPPCRFWLCLLEAKGRDLVGAQGLCHPLEWRKYSPLCMKNDV